MEEAKALNKFRQQSTRFSLRQIGKSRHSPVSTARISKALKVVQDKIKQDDIQIHHSDKPAEQIVDVRITTSPCNPMIII